MPRTAVPRMVSGASLGVSGLQGPHSASKHCQEPLKTELQQCSRIILSIWRLQISSRNQSCKLRLRFWRPRLSLLSLILILPLVFGCVCCCDWKMTFSRVSSPPESVLGKFLVADSCPPCVSRAGQTMAASAASRCCRRGRPRRRSPAIALQSWDHLGQPKLSAPRAASGSRSYNAQIWIILKPAASYSTLHSAHCYHLRTLMGKKLNTKQQGPVNPVEQVREAWFCASGPRPLNRTILIRQLKSKRRFNKNGDKQGLVGAATRTEWPQTYLMHSQIKVQAQVTTESRELRII